MTVFSITELREAVERELRLRRRVYPNRVDTGRMSQREADRQIALMETIAERLRKEEQATLLL